MRCPPLVRTSTAWPRSPGCGSSTSSARPVPMTPIRCRRGTSGCSWSQAARCSRCRGERVELGVGDWITIPAGTSHRVRSTRAGTQWIAVHGPHRWTCHRQRARRSLRRRCGRTPGTRGRPDMRDDNINHAFLDGVLAGDRVDVYYHFGVASDDPVLERFRDVRAVILAGSGDRIDEFAQRWSALHGDAAGRRRCPRRSASSPATAPACCSPRTGWGCPARPSRSRSSCGWCSSSRAGTTHAMSEVFWARVGTSGGVGLPGGTVVVTTEGVMADLRPYRLLQGGIRGVLVRQHASRPTWREAIVAASAGTGIPIELGRTVAGNEFFLEQFRLDGAVCMETARVEDGLAGVDQRRGRAQHRDGGRHARRLPQPLGLPEVRDDLHHVAQPARGRPGDGQPRASCTRSASAPATCCSTT